VQPERRLSAPAAASLIRGALRAEGRVHSHHNLWQADDIDAATLYTEAFVRVLATDANVQQAYGEWCARVTATFTQQQERQPELPAAALVAAALFIDDDANAAPFRLVADLDLAYLGWLPHLLLDLWRTSAIGVDLRFIRPTPSARELGETTAAYFKRLEKEMRPARGRAAKGLQRLDLVERDVTWFYRRHIKKDRLADITSDFLKSKSHTAAHHSTPQKAINRVKERPSSRASR
jgi:hypothetical protein